MNWGRSRIHYHHRGLTVVYLIRLRHTFRMYHTPEHDHLKARGVGPMHVVCFRPLALDSSTGKSLFPAAFQLSVGRFLSSRICHFWINKRPSRFCAAVAVPISFCFIAKTDRNVDVLDRAGVLGAVLALIAREATSVRKKRPLSKASADCLQVNTPPAHALASLGGTIVVV